MKKTIVISKHIHSSGSSYSSGDEFVVFITNSNELDFSTLEAGSFIQSSKFPLLNGQQIKEISSDSKFIAVYLEADKTFYYRSVFSESIANTPEFKSLVQSYLDKGFVINRDIPEELAFNKRNKAKQNRKDKKAGIVLCVDYEEYKNNTAIYKGGFSDELFNSPKLKAYVEGGCVFGWIGHRQGRTHASDKQIEAGLKERGISIDKMYNWISSGDGRHFGDSLEGYSKKEQKEKIELYLNSMYNSCIVYGCPAHEGTMNSSNTLESIFDVLGITLPYGTKYDHDLHLRKLANAKQILMKKIYLSQYDKYAEQVINEVLANKTML